MARRTIACLLLTALIFALPPAARADGGFALCLCGEGDVPLAAAAAALKAADYAGCLTFEWEKRWHPEIAGPEIAIPHFARVMRALWNEG